MKKRFFITIFFIIILFLKIDKNNYLKPDFLFPSPQNQNKNQNFKIFL